MNWAEYDNERLNLILTDSENYWPGRLTRSMRQEIELELNNRRGGQNLLFQAHQQLPIQDQIDALQGLIQPHFAEQPEIFPQVVPPQNVPMQGPLAHEWQPVPLGHNRDILNEWIDLPEPQHIPKDSLSPHFCLFVDDILHFGQFSRCLAQMTILTKDTVFRMLPDGYFECRGAFYLLLRLPGCYKLVSQ